MRKLLFALLAIPLTGCIGGTPQYATLQPMSPAAAREVSAKCEQQYNLAVSRELDLYGVYGDDERWSDMGVNRYKCYQRHGLKWQGYRQRDGSVTPDRTVSPTKAIEDY